MAVFEEKIGTNAGTVWAYLSESGKKSLKEVKKASKLTEKDLYASLGWLAREGKISVTESAEDIFVELA
ncbi:winged helix-turn-helix domain-containing protein [Viscerimonas tarda]